MTKIPYTKESARKLWTEARDKYQMQLDSKKRKGSFSHEAHKDRRTGGVIHEL